jgi:hypothetical protein
VLTVRPAFPAPSLFFEGYDDAKPGREAPREGKGVSSILVCDPSFETPARLWQAPQDEA